MNHIADYIIVAILVLIVLRAVSPAFGDNAYDDLYGQYAYHPDDRSVLITEPPTPRYSLRLFGEYTYNYRLWRTGVREQDVIAEMGRLHGGVGVPLFTFYDDKRMTVLRTKLKIGLTDEAKEQGISSIELADLRDYAWVGFEMRLEY